MKNKIFIFFIIMISIAFMILSLKFYPKINYKLFYEKQVIKTIENYNGRPSSH